MFSSLLTQSLSSHFPTPPKIILALSGGPDSVFLGEHLFDVFSSRRGWPSSPAKDASEYLIVAHFDHQIRDDSSEDAEFCRKWAEEKGLTFFSEKWEAPQDSEEKARKARFSFLEKIRDQEKADAIALGTHGDDVAETIFFNFLRGSGLSGLSGINEFDTERKIFRPLLSLKKTEILDYLKEKQIPYRTDSTNLESDYSRNYLRNEVFPLLQSKFPGFEERLLRQAEIFEMTDDFVKKSAKGAFSGSPGLRSAPPEEDEKSKGASPLVWKEKEVKTSRLKFLSLHPLLQSEVLRQIFSPKILSFEQNQRLREFIKTAESGKKTECAGKTLAVYAEDFFVD